MIHICIGIMSTMLKMMLSTVRPFRRKSVRTLPKVTPLSKNVQNGPSKSVLPRRSRLRSTHLKLSVKRFPVSSAAHQVVSSNLAQRNVLTGRRLLFQRFLRRPVTLSPKRSASTSPNWCPYSSLLRSALTSPRRSAPGPAPTQGRSRSQLSRSGATCQLLSPDLLKSTAALPVNLTKNIFVKDNLVFLIGSIQYHVISIY